MGHNDGIMMGILKLAAPVPAFLTGEAIENQRLAKKVIETACPALPLVKSVAKKVKENPQKAKEVINAAVPQTLLAEHVVKNLANNPKETAKTAMKLASPAAGILSIFL